MTSTLETGEIAKSWIYVRHISTFQFPTLGFDSERFNNQDFEYLLVLPYMIIHYLINADFQSNSSLTLYIKLLAYKFFEFFFT